ncbi:hypothetical protein LWF15_18905 [Kineosporia rhizophila]|uniref:hypothetical protein n=1 Tax=Kineosporia rhizophila TaxID=84633 RepID=UPI001E4F76EA|nr:hypothetical protein [Kineosporia rhizophila]MCE0537562.1 hypothetical protein [Kineosporia rhizophila]
MSSPHSSPAAYWPGGRIVAAVAITVLAILLIVHFTRDGSGGHRAVDHTPALAGQGQSTARLVVHGGTDRLTVIAADLGGDLVQAQTPDTQSAVPVLREQDPETVSVSTEAADQDGGGGVDLAVKLARDVRWQIQIDGGSSALTLDLREGRVQSLDVTQGVATIQAYLPHPDGVLPTRISGGANSISLTLPANVSAQATFSGGGGSADLDGVHHGGLAAGTVLTTPERSEDRLEVDLASGVGSFGLRREG